MLLLFSCQFASLTRKNKTVWIYKKHKIDVFIEVVKKSKINHMCFFFFSVILLEGAYQKLQKTNKSVGKVNAILLTIMTTATTLVTLLNDQRFRNFPAIFSQFQTRMHLNQPSLFSLDVVSLHDKSICTSRLARTSLYSLAYFTF